MKDMKLIMESWRRYSAPSSGIPMMIFENDKVEFFYLEEKISLLKESNRDSEIEVLFEKWLDQSEIILEIGVPKFIKDFVSDETSGKEVDSEFITMIKDLMTNPILTLSIQLGGFLLRIKQASIPILVKVANVVSKINAKRESFKEKNPLLYKVLAMIVKVAVILLIVYVVKMLMSSGLCEGRVMEEALLLELCRMPDGSIKGADSGGFQQIIGKIAETEPEFAAKLGKILKSEHVFDYNEFGPAIRETITDAYSSIDSLKGDINRFGQYPEFAAETAKDMSKLDKFGEVGREILDNVSKTVESMGDTAATTVTQTQGGNDPMLAKNLLMGMMKSDSSEKIAQLANSLKDLNIISPEDLERAIRAGNMNDGRTIIDIMKTVPAP